MPTTTAFNGPDASIPAVRAVAVTPSDSDELSTTRSLYIGTGGNIVVTMAGADVTFSNVIGGTILPVQVTKVKSTSTTASNIVALY